MFYHGSGKICNLLSKNAWFSVQYYWQIKPFVFELYQYFDDDRWHAARISENHHHENVRSTSIFRFSVRLLIELWAVFCLPSTMSNFVAIRTGSKTDYCRNIYYKHNNDPPGYSNFGVSLEWWYYYSGGRIDYRWITVVNLFITRYENIESM